MKIHNRNDDTQHEVVPNDSGSQYIGRRAATQFERYQIIQSSLPPNEPGKTVEDILEAWAENSVVPKPDLKTIEDDLKRGAKLRIWQCAGEGKHNGHLRYRRRKCFFK